MEVAKVKRKAAPGEGPLRIDHSDVYFENDRLSEELGVVKDILLRYKHRQFLNRDGEIKELRRTLNTLEAMKKSTKTETQKRPKTTPAYMSRPQRPASTATQARVVKLDVRIPDDSDSDSFSDSSDDSDSIVKSRETVAVVKTRPQIQPQVTTRAGLIRAQIGHQQFPPSWYTDVLQPGESSMKKRTPIPASGFGPGRNKSAGKRSKKEIPDKKQKESSAMTEADDEPRLVCGRSKSAVLSRRKLIQMTNLDHITDTDDKVEPVQALRDMNRIQNDRLQIRVKMFLDSLDAMKKQREAVQHRRQYGGYAVGTPEPLW